ncbi:MAG: hypothetical protein IPG76_12510 [Acidobacteria bacterium]|nr:hypothetical protein [Acidobacteriota bacterium]
MLIITLMASMFMTLALGFYVLVAAPHRAVNRTFGAFVGMMILWIIKDLLFWGFHEYEQNAGWWAAISFLIGIVLQLVFCFSPRSFLKTRRPEWEEWCSSPFH